MIFHFKMLDYKIPFLNKLIIIFRYIILLTFLISLRNSFAKNTLTLMTPPSPAEFYVNVAKELFKISDTEYKQEIHPLPEIFSIMQSVNSNDSNIYSTVAILNEKNLNLFYNTGHIANIQTAFFSLKDSNLNIISLESAKKINKICVWLDSVLYKYLISQGFQNLAPVPTLAQCAISLFNKKVDAWFNSESTVVKTLLAKKLDVKSIQRGFSPLNVTFFLAVTKNAPKEMITKLQIADKKIRDTGKYDEILTQYRDALFLPK
ncbi:transporter substrate-binding domain-containing protein [Fluviispira multicolorata]|uniref:Transporter substrate-binding domain-containing protein n=1 Tax=Fluviispira multicolorata TaxID=2654512 RepID=A0A833JDR5_9BACT|nr:transporter substrate-binding domain-containing protein [Fluviispira multicolorata]KAB8029126.1 transporter substrate-binding domain-containing protein [Fluviispira multicolorata]